MYVRSKKGLRVLDLGCGDGLVGEGLRKRGYTTITGVDFSQPMLDKSADRGEDKFTYNYKRFPLGGVELVTLRWETSLP